MNRKTIDFWFRLWYNTINGGDHNDLQTFIRRQNHGVC